MKQKLRLLLAFFSFFQFFTAGVVLGVVFFPLVRLFVWSRARYRRLASRFLGFIYPSFLFWMKLAGLISYERVPLPDFVPREGAFVLVSNHPTLIDVVFLLGWVPRITTTVKAAWLRSWLAGPLLRAADYVPGPGVKGDQDGTPAFEAAVRAGVPILPVYIDARPPGLNKERFVPEQPIRFQLTWLGVVDSTRPEDDPRALMKRTRDMIATEHERVLASDSPP